MFIIDFFLNNTIWFIEFILMFSFLIIIHECGHFWAARWAGVKVLEFGVGFGKKVWGWKRGDTEYNLNLIPFGGFVRMLGEEERSKDPRSFEQAPLYKRVIITVGGVFMNFLSAILLLTFLFTIGTNPILVTKDDIKGAYEDGYFGYQKDENTFIANKGTTLAEGKKMKLEHLSWEEVQALKETEKLQGGYLKEVKMPLGKAFLFSFSETWRISGAIIQKVSEIPGHIIEEKRLPEGMAGPLGIADVTKKMAALGFLYLVKLAAMLSISLGVMNLLPIPALDGGRLFFQFIELCLKPFKIKPNETIENYAHVAGFVLLLGFLVVVTIEDVIRIWFS